jgi:hypothetical protein
MGEYRKAGNEDLYSSPNITGVIKSIKIKCTGHDARMERREVHTGPPVRP